MDYSVSSLRKYTEIFNYLKMEATQSEIREKIGDRCARYVEYIFPDLCRPYAANLAKMQQPRRARLGGNKPIDQKVCLSLPAECQIFPRFSPDIIGHIWQK